MKNYYDNRFFSVEKEKKLLICPKQDIFLSWPFEKENNIFSSQNNVPKYHPGRHEKDLYVLGYNCIPELETPQPILP